MSNSEPISKAQSLQEAGALVDQGRYLEALNKLLPFETEQSDKKIMYGLAYCYYKLKDFAHARSFAERAVVLGSTKASVLVEHIRQKLSASVEQEPDTGVQETPPTLDARNDAGLPQEGPPTDTSRTDGVGLPWEEPATDATRDEVRAGEHAREAARHLQALLKQGAQAVKTTAAPAAKRAGVMLVEGAASLREKMKTAAESGGTLYPWLPSPERILKVEQYKAAGAAKDFRCKANESLNVFTKNQAAQGGVKSQLLVCPDIVGVEGRPLSCLERLILLCLWVLSLVFAPVTLVFFGIVVVGALFLLMTIVTHPLLLIPFLVFAAVCGALYYFALGLVKRYYDWCAEVIRRNPKSPLAITLMHLYSPLIPRYWERGEIEQIFRVTRSQSLCGSRAFVLFVQDNPIVPRPGCLDHMLGTRFPFCYLMAKRRIYSVWLDEGEGAADLAAEKAAQVLGLTVQRGYISRWGVRVP